MKKIFALTVLFILPSLSFAGPTVIKDSRVRDHSTTPVLGRGYSAITNTFQSVCLQGVTVTEPSYDFQYKLIDVYTSADYEKHLDNKLAIDFIGTSIQAGVDAAANSKETAHHLVVILNMDTYYASVDESGSKISESARTLIERQDLPGFFSACGPYYVRGITRNAQFVSILEYRTKTKERNVTLDAHIKKNLNGGGIFGKLKSAAIGDMTIKNDTTLTKSSKQHLESLTIISRGWGLGKSKGASLVSTSIEEFKTAIKDAFVSMQNPLTGQVISVEVVPWAENTDFQATLDIHEKDLVDGKEVPLHKKKDILTYNAEFMAEAERASRNKLDRYYKSKLCKSDIEGRWYSSGQFNKAYENTSLLNNRTGKDNIKAVDLDKLLTGEYINGIWNGYEQFMYGGSPNLQSCLDDLMADPNQKNVADKARGTGADADALAGMRADQDYEAEGRGLFLKRFIEHDSCKSLQTKFISEFSQDVDDYCMPVMSSR